VAVSDIGFTSSQKLVKYLRKLWYGRPPRLIMGVVMMTANNCFGYFEN
jgi:hypothetical protein